MYLNLACLELQQIDQLVEYSKTDPEVIKFTSDPKRFKDSETAKKWLKNVSVYTLTDGKNLMGIAWFHILPIPERKFTIKLNPNDFSLTYAIRIYGEARGKGLGVKFMKDAFDDYKPKNLWGQISSENIPSIKLAEKFGFKKVSEPDQRGKIIMVLHKRHPELVSGSI